MIQSFLDEFDFLKPRWRSLAVVFGLLAAAGVVFLKEWSLPPFALGAVTLACGAGALYLSLRQPEILIYLLLAYLPFSGRFSGKFMQIIPGVNPLILLIALASIYYLFGRFAAGLVAGARRASPVQPGHASPDMEDIRPVFQWQWGPLGLPAAVFLGFAFLSLIHVGVNGGLDYIGKGFFRLSNAWLVPLFLHFLFYNLAAHRDLMKTSVLVIAVAVGLVGFLAVYEGYDTGERVGGIFAEANRIAAFFSYYMFLCLGLFFIRPGKWWSLGFLGAFLVCLRGLMMSLSRGGYLAFALSLYAVAFLKSKILFAGLIVATAVVLMNPQFLPDSIRNRLAQTIDHRAWNPAPIQDDVPVDRSTGDRIEIWKAGLQMTARNPVWGVGYDRFRAKVQNYWYAGIPFDAHNGFLQVAAEMGIPALLVYLWMLGVLFWEVLKTWFVSKDRFWKCCALGFVGGFVGYLVSQLYVSRLDFTEIAAYFWILAAVLMRAGKEGKDGHEFSAPGIEENTMAPALPPKV